MFLFKLFKRFITPEQNKAVSVFARIPFRADGALWASFPPRTSGTSGTSNATWPLDALRPLRSNLSLISAHALGTSRARRPSCARVAFRASRTLWASFATFTLRSLDALGTCRTGFTLRALQALRACRPHRTSRTSQSLHPLWALWASCSTFTLWALQALRTCLARSCINYGHIPDILHHSALKLHPAPLWHDYAALVQNDVPAACSGCIVSTAIHRDLDLVIFIESDIGHVGTLYRMLNISVVQLIHQCVELGDYDIARNFFNASLHFQGAQSRIIGLT